MIDKSKVDQFNLQKAYIDNLKMYINPEMFAKEMGYDTKNKNDFSKENSEFYQHSMTARAFGKPKLSPLMEKAVKSSHEDRNNKNVKTIYVDKLEDFDRTEKQQPRTGIEIDDTD